MARYLDRSGLFSRLAEVFKRYRANQKGASAHDILRQTLAFFVYGTSRHLKRDPGYAATLETRPEQLAIFHSVKRFFNKAVRDQFLISTLGTGKVFKRIDQAQRAALETTDFIIGMHHRKGADALTHCRIKDFGYVALPCNRFCETMALYYRVLIG